MKRIFFVFICLWVTLYAQEGAKPNTKDAKGYELGEGYQIGKTPIYIGGYLSVDYTHYTNVNLKKIALSDISFLSYGSYHKFSYMAEMEFKNYYMITWRDEKKTTNKNTKLYAERLYIDYTANENFLARVGKYNSNVGYWNLTPINVLRDTTSSPATSRLIFPEYTTGLDLRYQYFNQADIAVNISLQNNNSIDEEYNNFFIKKHFGAGVEYSYDDLSIKLNGGYFHKKNHQQNYVDNYYGYLSFLYNNDVLKLMGAIGHRDTQGTDAVRLSTYLQATYEFTSHHYPVIRIEHYDAQVNVENNITKDSSVVLGYTYRPIYPVAFKVEYQIHSNRSLDKFLTSFSVMF
jgi:hypothetical protein